MAKIDHHLHTARHSPDSIIDPDELLERVRELGLDGVVITEHDHLWDPDEVAELQARAPDLTILAGVEVSAREGHFLVYGLPDLDDAPSGVELANLVQLVERHDAAIVAAHPYRWDQPMDEILGAHGPVFHALELVSTNVSRETRARTERVLKAHPTLGATGSSDAHVLGDLGSYYTEFPGPIRSMSDFVRALRSGEGRPGHHPAGRMACGPVAWPVVSR